MREERESHVLGRLRELEERNRVPRGVLGQNPPNQVLEADFEDKFFYKLVLLIKEVNLHFLFV